MHIDETFSYFIQPEDVFNVTYNWLEHDRKNVAELNEFPSHLRSSQITVSKNHFTHSIYFDSSPNPTEPSWTSSNHPKPPYYQFFQPLKIPATLLRYPLKIVRSVTGSGCSIGGAQSRGQRTAMRIENARGGKVVSCAASKASWRCATACKSSATGSAGRNHVYAHFCAHLRGTTPMHMLTWRG